ncbi:MAG: hypothetical protein JST22_03590 [Bacteroidetes bacterium]|nr:hypothetical protein [Bacteroidota bacterium]
MSLVRMCKRTHCAAVAAATVVAALVGLAPSARAQVFEMRHVFEQYHDWRIMVGGSVTGPLRSQLDPVEADHNVAFDSSFDGRLKVSLDLWQIRLGLSYSRAGSLSPYLFWNPRIGETGFGTDSSRWSASVGWEGIFSADRDFNPLKLLQADNSIYTPKNSFSVVVGYWFGSKLDSNEMRAVLQKAYPDLRGNDLETWVTMQTMVDTNYAGRGLVDTSNYRTPPLDTNSYVRGMKMLPGIPQHQREVRYVTRQGFSAGIGLGSGQYAGSGPISKYLNFFYSFANERTDTSGLHDLGLNPLLVFRYRFDDYIAHLEVAGEDVNGGLILRNFRNFDIEVGLKYLEHIFYRASRGDNRTTPFLSVRYAPSLHLGDELIEKGENLFTPELDSDGDGIPDGLELNVTHTDPFNPDTDGDGLSDGLEVNTYKTNPLNPDTDGDGLSDGQEILTPGRRTDPLRADTDDDGISDGEEVLRGSDPLVPAVGERGR